VAISQGDVLWAELRRPVGSGPGYRRPVVVLQGDALNRSRIATALCVPLTSNLRLAEAAGNVLLKARFTSLPRDSVANLSQIIALDRRLLVERAGHLDRTHLEALLSGLDIVLGRSAA
jgi:mRNA interferase MazF